MSEDDLEGMSSEEMGEEKEPMQPEEEMGKMEMDMGADSSASEDDRLWVLLAYVFTPIVPIVLMLWAEKKERPFVKAHNAQALVWGVFNAVIGSILSTFLCGLPSLAIWLVGVYWGWQAYQGQSVTIPFVTDFVKQQGWA